MKNIMCFLLCVIILCQGLGLNNISNTNIPIGTYGKVIHKACFRAKPVTTAKCIIIIPIDHFTSISSGPINGMYYGVYPVNNYKNVSGYIQAINIVLIYPPKKR